MNGGNEQLLQTKTTLFMFDLIGPLGTRQDEVYRFKKNRNMFQYNNSDSNTS